MRLYRLLYSASRVTKPSTNWADFQKNLPEAVSKEFKEFIASSQAIATSVSSKSETKPPIDFDFYRQRLSDPKFVDMLEKQYNDVQVPYPEDTEGIEQKISAAWDAEKEYAEKLYSFADGYQFINEKMIEQLTMLPRYEDMTQEMLYYYFPESMNRKSEYPHTVKVNKLQNDPGLKQFMTFKSWNITKKVPPPVGEGESK
uniref:Putative mitochondrial ATP synthase-like protein n=1 Tax=Pinctada fucata TaxID=50426 RepID=A0A194AMP2_PINFU